MFLRHLKTPSTNILRRHNSYIAAIDQGTSSTRVILYDNKTLTPTFAHQVSLADATSTPQAGWVQMNPKALLHSIETCFEGVLNQAKITTQDIISVGITNQRESLVIWDRHTGEPLFDIILWLDTRTRSTVSDLETKLKSTDALRDITGLPLSTYFTGVKLKWMMDNVPAVKQAIEQGTAQIGTVDAFIAKTLTNQHITDVTNASRTLMMDLNSCTWSDEAIDALGLPREITTNEVLPTITSSADTLGTIVSKTSAFEGVPLTGIIGDQQSAMVGQRCFTAGMAKTTYGTGAFTLMNTGTVPYTSKHGLLTTCCYSNVGALDSSQVTYALEGAVGSCAVGIDWFLHKLDLFKDPIEFDQFAEKALKTKGTEGLYFVSAFGGLLAPRWDDTARGTMVGLTLGHDKSHIALAIAEGIAFQVKDVATAMVNDTNGRHPLIQMQVDGGVSKSNPLLQTQANLLNVNVVRPQNVETTAMGCAIVTGAGAGLWDTYESSPLGGGEKNDSVVFESELMDDEFRFKRFESWEAAVKSSIEWADRV